MASTYLLTWNPTRYAWEELTDQAHRAANGDSVTMRWSSGNRKRIERGDRIFMMRLGSEPRGIVASGVACGEPEADTHWDDERAAQGDTTLFVEIAFDLLLDPANTPPLAYARLGERWPEYIWAPQAAGRQIPDAIARELELMWLSHVGHAPNETDAELAAYEGQVQLRVVRHRHRERQLRAQKIEQRLREAGRLACEVPGCGFDFERVYGSAAAGFAHVHHLEPLAELDAPRRNTLEDQAIVCANCHAFIHLGGGCRPLDGLLTASAQQNY